MHIGQLSFYDFHINQKISYLNNLGEDDIEILKKYILSITNFILSNLLLLNVVKNLIQWKHIKFT